MSRRLCAIVFFVGAVFGCNGTHTGNPVEEGPEGPDERIITGLSKITKVDILFVMDNSGSMGEHEALAHEMPRLIRALVTGDRDGDGTPELEPAESVHLGVVSSDLGLPGINMSPDPEGKCQGLGDDGVLQHENIDPAAVNDCAGPFPPFISHELDEDDPDQTAHDFGCMLRLGMGGCGFEQHLEAALKALWPSNDDGITFFADHDGSGAQGHGDGENAGFLRDDSLLAVVVVSDEDDCSPKNIHLFEDPSTAGIDLAEQPLNLRCHHNKDELHPIERYVDNFKALRPGMEERVIFGAIAGVPPELVEDKADLLEHVLGKVEADPAELEDFYAGILEHEDMQETIIPEGQEIFGEPNRNLMPACYVENPDFDPNVPYHGDDLDSEIFTSKATPARRLVQVARAFGANGVVQSICQENFVPPVEALVLALTNRMIESAEQDEDE